ncbi:MAG: hypothetical protein ABI655_12150, partial [Phenylobacterium sp.]
DTLSGGFGPDKFVFSPASGVDRLLDYTPGEDHILLFDAQGGIADGSHGVLMFDAGGHTLSWDPDGTFSPIPSEALAVMDGVTRIERSDLAAGFYPNAIQVVAADGSTETTVIEWGSATLDTRVAEQSPTDVMTSYTANFKDGSHWTKWFDAESNQPWEGRTAEYDASGALFHYTVAYDTGEQVQWSFDPHNSETWQRLVDDYDAQGRLLTRGYVQDDGTSKLATFDVDGSHPWQMLVDIFDAAGRLIGHWTYNDDGSFIG